LKSSRRSSKSNKSSSNSKSNKNKSLETIEFTAVGRRISLTKDQAIRKLRGTKPGVIYVHAVEINGVEYPVKQAFAVLTGLDPMDFGPAHARAIFRRLGFKVIRKK
jgi:hypothetical protein